MVEEFDSIRDAEGSTKIKKESSNNSNEFLNRKRKKNIGNSNNNNDEDVKTEDTKQNEIAGGTSGTANSNKDNNSSNGGIEKEKNLYCIDDRYKLVQTIKQQDGKLIAITEKDNENGGSERVYIPTDELRVINPWILLNFYESKIKFA